MSNYELHLGDCLEYMRGMAAGSVDAIITDIPYNEANRDNNGLRNLDKGAADSSEIDLPEVMKEMVRVCAGSFYVFCGFQQFSFIDSYFRSQCISRRCIVWEKTNPSPMNGESIWLSGVELCVYGKKPKATYNGFCKNTVIKYKTGGFVSDHPTEKPVKIMEDFIIISSNLGDTIFDPFMGSGSTGVACMQLGRKFIGCEINEQYYNIAKRRIEQAALQEPLFT